MFINNLKHHWNQATNDIRYELGLRGRIEHTMKKAQENARFHSVEFKEMVNNVISISESETENKSWTDHVIDAKDSFVDLIKDSIELIGDSIGHSH